VQKTLFFKILAIIGLTLMICVPLALIQATIGQRMQFRQQAVQSIANDSVGPQSLAGPVIVIRYTDEFEESVTPADKSKPETVTRAVARQFLVFPNELEINGTINTERRYRGIHQVLVFSGQHALKGDFVLPELADLPRDNPRSRIAIRSAQVALGIADVRGIRNIPKLDWDGTKIEFQQGTGLNSRQAGLHAPLPLTVLAGPRNIRFAFDLGLDGIEDQHFVPVAKSNKVTLNSNWPHAQYGGRFLPSPGNRSNPAGGFAATWNISSLATGVQQQFQAAELSEDAKAAAGAGIDRFSVSFIEPVNVYSMADRATKYGLLFVALTFAAFFVFEILKTLPIHPVQYLLVGLALALFFLLLVGLSEHIAFELAYSIASAACIALIGFYLSHVLHDRKRGFGFGAALTALYGALYGLLISENVALLLGSLLLFAVLAALMIATRKVDWYQIGKVPESVPV
jgi:inner membrane protein